MWRNDHQIVLNEIIVATQEISDHYQYAAGIVEDDVLTRLFSELADSHQSITNQLTTYIERAGGLPDIPDQDRETVQQLVSQLKSLFVQDSQSLFMEERTQAEMALEQILKPALMLSWEGEDGHRVKQLLIQLRQLATDAQQRLSNAGKAL